MKSIFIFLFSLYCLISVGQDLQAALEKDRSNKALRVAFYNVENLFDTIDDAKIRDEEFLPASDKNWNSYKYRLKIANMAKVIRAVGGWQAPEIVGVAEIENRLVMLDLADHPALASARYDVLHFDSPDPRGIDVGLLFNRDRVTVLHAQPIKMRKDNFRTRDILYAKLLITAADTLHIFVNHWSSRRGGKEQSEPKRVLAAEIVQQYTDSIQRTDSTAAIVVMGDFNDAPADKSLKLLSEEAQFPLNNLMQSLPATSGSHKYRGVWSYLDQILVSSCLYRGCANLHIGQGVHVYRAEFLLEEDDRYGDDYPYRTWKGPVFIAGFSDHLPVFVDVIYNQQ
jgi:predicted extracellular nuclease